MNCRIQLDINALKKIWTLFKFLTASQLLAPDKLSNFSVILDENNFTEFFKYIWIYETRVVHFGTLLDVSSLNNFSSNFLQLDNCWQLMSFQIRVKFYMHQKLIFGIQLDLKVLNKFLKQIFIFDSSKAVNSW